MWVLEKLVEKDEAAQSGVGDPAVFLGKGDADEEEAVVAEAVSAGIGADAFDAQMNARADEAKTQMSLDDEFAALFGDYAAPAETKADGDTATEGPPPRLFPDTFSYAAAMIGRLSRAEERAFPSMSDISMGDRTIRIT